MHDNAWIILNEIWFKIYYDLPSIIFIILRRRYSVLHRPSKTNPSRPTEDYAEQCALHDSVEQGGNFNPIIWNLEAQVLKSYDIWTDFSYTPPHSMITCDFQATFRTWIEFGIFEKKTYWNEVMKDELLNAFPNHSLAFASLHFVYYIICIIYKPLTNVSKI